MAALPLSLKGRALRLLGGREHSRAELERKLATYEEEPGSLARALDELQAKGFVDEQRVIESAIAADSRGDRVRMLAVGDSTEFLW